MAHKEQCIFSSFSIFTILYSVLSIAMQQVTLHRTEGNGWAIKALISLPQLHHIICQIDKFYINTFYINTERCRKLLSQWAHLWERLKPHIRQPLTLYSLIGVINVHHLFIHFPAHLFIQSQQRDVFSSQHDSYV